MIIRVANNGNYFIIPIDKRGKMVMSPLGDITIVGKPLQDDVRSIDTHLLDVTQEVYNSLQSYARSYNAIRTFMKSKSK